MATKKDLVEAYQFSRRRLVTAFVSGAPGGREVEPTRPGRTLVGGIALAVLVLAGAGVARVLSPATAEDWTQPGLVSEEETGADYVILEDDPGSPTLRPVANVTSAMLLLGSDVEPTVVPREEIAQEERGDRIGILQAPATPPPTSALVNSGWTACTGASARGEGATAYGTQVTVAADPPVGLAPDAGFVVSVGDRWFLVAQAPGHESGEPARAYAYEVPAGDNRAAVLAAVADLPPVPVPPDWLKLFPRGGALSLSTFGIDAETFGSRPSAPEIRATGARVGDVLEVQSNGERYVVRDEDVLELDPFSTAVYGNLDYPDQRGARVRTAAAVPAIEEIPRVATEDQFYWPTEELRSVPSSDLCAVMVTDPDGEPAALLGTPADGGAADVAPGRVEVEVAPGSGAVVRFGGYDGAASGDPVLIDDRGRSYRLAGEAPSLLGYAGVPGVVVPEAWLDLFTASAVLSVDAARCPPTSDPDQTC